MSIIARAQRGSGRDRCTANRIRWQGEDNSKANPPAGSPAGPATDSAAAPRDKKTHKVHLMVLIGATKMLRRIKQDEFSVSGNEQSQEFRVYCWHCDLWKYNVIKNVHIVFWQHYYLWVAWLLIYNKLFFDHFLAIQEGQEGSHQWEYELGRACFL